MAQSVQRINATNRCDSFVFRILFIRTQFTFWQKLASHFYYVSGSLIVSNVGFSSPFLQHDTSNMQQLQYSCIQYNVLEYLHNANTLCFKNDTVWVLAVQNLNSNTHRFLYEQPTIQLNFNWDHFMCICI